MKKREALRRWVRIKSDALKRHVEADSPSQVALNRAIAEFDEKMRECEELQRSIEDAKFEDDAAYQAEIEDSQIFREEAFAQRDQAAELLMRMCEEERAASVANESNVSDSTSASRTIQVKLPKLQLPHFNGNILDFRTFWDNFEAHVDQQNMPVITKFSHLMSLLEGEAKRVISGLSLTNANYPVAIEMIKNRFGDEDRIVAAHIHALIMVSAPPSCKGTKHISELWRMFDELNRNIKCLEALKVDGKQYGRVLTPIILSRLPEDLRLEWSRS